YDHSLKMISNASSRSLGLPGLGHHDNIGILGRLVTISMLLLPYQKLYISPLENWHDGWGSSQNIHWYCQGCGKDLYELNRKITDMVFLLP
ncbi:hypothetical protein DBR06_SOUSAS7610052, partial [Sousa chinensis]